MEKKTNFKTELKYFLFTNLGIAIALALVLLWRQYGEQLTILPDCGFKMFLHIYCPGCGGTRAVYELLKLHIWSSFLYHPIVPFCAIILVEYYIGAVITLIKNNGKKYYYLRDWFCYVALGIIIANWIIKNVMAIAFHYDYIGDIVQYWIK